MEGVILCQFCNTYAVNKKEESLNDKGESVVIYECNCGRTTKEVLNVDKDGKLYMED